MNSLNKKDIKKKSNLSVWNRFVHNNNTVGYVFLAPFIIGFLAFTLIPMGTSLYYSFTNFNMIDKKDFIGFENYINLFKDSRFLNSLKVTIVYVIISVPTKLAFALLIAFVLTRPNKMVSFYRSLYYLPSLVGGSVAVALVWKQLFARAKVLNGVLQGGLVNVTLTRLGLDTVNWFGTPAAAKWPIILMAAWQFGSSMLIFAAGLKEIPGSYYEAAKIDGANGWQMFFKITLPCLSPIILFNLVMQLISSFMVFTQALIITNGGPNDATMYYALYVYKQGINERRMGYASAMSWVMLIIMGLATFLVFKTSKHWVFDESAEG